MSLLPAIILVLSLGLPVLAVYIPFAAPLGGFFGCFVGPCIANIIWSLGTAVVGSIFVFIGLFVLVIDLADFNLWDPYSTMAKLGDTFYYIMIICTILAIIGTIFQLNDDGKTEKRND